MTYAVIAPHNINGTVKPLTCFVSDDLEAAKYAASCERLHLQKIGRDIWASQVRLVRASTPGGHIDLANQALEMGHQLGTLGGALIEWSRVLKVRADELANPESYAD